MNHSLFPFDEPRIFVEVLRPIGDGHFARSRKEISLMEWINARYAGVLAECAINAALAELGYRLWWPSVDLNP